MVPGHIAIAMAATLRPPGGQRAGAHNARFCRINTLASLASDMIKL
jgi:hypothetical protein